MLSLGINIIYNKDKHISIRSALVLVAAHALSGPHDLVDEEQLLCEGGGDVEPLLFGAVVVVDLLLNGRDGPQALYV